MTGTHSINPERNERQAGHVQTTYWHADPNKGSPMNPCWQCGAEWTYSHTTPKDDPHGWRRVFIRRHAPTCAAFPVVLDAPPVPEPPDDFAPQTDAERETAAVLERLEDEIERRAARIDELERAIGQIATVGLRAAWEKEQLAKELDEEKQLSSYGVEVAGKATTAYIEMWGQRDEARAALAKAKARHKTLRIGLAEADEAVERLRERLEDATEYFEARLAACRETLVDTDNKLRNLYSTVRNNREWTDKWPRTNKLIRDFLEAQADD